MALTGASFGSNVAACLFTCCHIGERKLGDGREEKVGRHGKSGAPRAERALGQGALEMTSFGSAKSCGSK